MLESGGKNEQYDDTHLMYCNVWLSVHYILLQHLCTGDGRVWWTTELMTIQRQETARSSSALAAYWSTLSIGMMMRIVMVIDMRITMLMMMRRENGSVQ